MSKLDLEGLELSTQNIIERAVERGIQVEILDRESNAIRLTKGTHREIIIQATRTSRDTYIAPLIMSNKHLTKILLEEAGIHTPRGHKVKSVREGMKLYEELEGSRIVIKPLSTNFGVGITMLTRDYDRTIYEEALKVAFSKDSLILIEDYIEGKEYRFLVIGDQVIGILHRVPANVTGDGTMTIRELVEKKNQDPLRGQGYVRPLEIIQLGAFEKNYLSEQGMTFETIPQVGQTVYLRKNSNISTGGDSLDFTDDMHDSYKEIAVKASQAVGALICGVDMIVPDIRQYDEGYSIIELNFNPAIHIHNAPYKGKNRHADAAVLDLLGF